MPVEKEKKPSKKEKYNKVIYKPDYKFPNLKIPRQVYESIKNVEPLSKDEMKAYLTAIALGAVPDRFGMEASLQDKMKAIDQLAKLSQDDAEQNEEETGVIIDDIPEDPTE